MAQDGLLKVLAALEPMVVQDVFNRVFELFDDYNGMVDMTAYACEWCGCLSLK